ncbi:major facilitator superfamily transporter [Trichodelitschia bisporula]|uniref:Major facilitator superfamily transporter n=1 Tax=Trichodelitschia bisporula TaxID=703511 RepID=A0A6G1HU14_9PEZI|nr:major facilitator superfamily transporter [Trichodelitschia bisporula]
MFGSMPKFAGLPRPDDAEYALLSKTEADASAAALEDVPLSAASEARLVRRIDQRIMPCLIAMIVLNYLDRNALANARVQGIEAALGMSGLEFNIAISVFFIGYIGLQVPSNLLLTRVRPSVYLPGCMIAWGLLSGMSAFVHGFKGLITVRFFLGMVEAPFFPGALFLLSSWYTREELALRTSILYSGSLVSGAFGGFVGAGIEANLDGVWGVASWRWLFIVEAMCTVGLAVGALFILPDYPHTTKFLSPDERTIATSRIQSHSGFADRKHGSLLTGLKAALTDYKVWLLALIIVTKTSAGAVTSFIPTLVATFGFSRVSTLLLVAPPYLFAALVALGVSYMSDRRGERAYHIVIPMLGATVGFAVAGSTMGLGVRYVSLFLMLAGVYGSYNVALAWISSTLPHPVEKRSAAIAIINTVGNMAQIWSPFFYAQGYAPRYGLAMGANTLFCLACIVATLVLRRCLVRENGRLVVEAAAGGRGVVGFRYVL